jgi:hypothetical protein
MILMHRVRRRCPSSQLRPDLRFVRTLTSPHHVVRDEQTGTYRISTKAFGPSSSDNKLSGDLEQILEDDGLTATAMYPAVRDSVGAAAIKVGDILATGATVEHDPVRTNFYHGSVLGTKPRGVRGMLLKAAIEIIAIDQAEALRLEEQFKAVKAAPQQDSGQLA